MRIWDDENVKRILKDIKKRRIMVMGAEGFEAHFFFKSNFVNRPASEINRICVT